MACDVCCWWFLKSLRNSCWPNNPSFCLNLLSEFSSGWLVILFHYQYVHLCLHSKIKASWEIWAWISCCLRTWWARITNPWFILVCYLLKEYFVQVDKVTLFVCVVLSGEHKYSLMLCVPWLCASAQKQSLKKSIPRRELLHIIKQAITNSKIYLRQRNKTEWRGEKV